MTGRAKSRRVGSEGPRGSGSGRRHREAPATLRRPRPGELGWVVQRHGEVYAREYGYDARFEGLVAKVVGDFVANFDPARERCWIADRDGRPVGSVFLTRLRGRTAKLRLLLVETSERGTGLGGRLVRACTTFARARGYTRIELWTQAELVAARRLYEREGYRLVATKRHAMFGTPAVAETWAMELHDKGE